MIAGFNYVYLSLKSVHQRRRVPDLYRWIGNSQLMYPIGDLNKI